MTIQDKKKWNKLFDTAHKNLKEHEQLLPQTIKALKTAYESHETDVVDSTDLEVESVDTMLFYAK